MNFFSQVRRFGPKTHFKKISMCVATNLMALQGLSSESHVAVCIVSMATSIYIYWKLVVPYVSYSDRLLSTFLWNFFKVSQIDKHEYSKINCTTIFHCRLIYQSTCRPTCTVYKVNLRGNLVFAFSWQLNLHCQISNTQK